jgi:hypothetical protein
MRKLFQKMASDLFPVSKQTVVGNLGGTKSASHGLRLLQGLENHGARWYLPP